MLLSLLAGDTEDLDVRFLTKSNLGMTEAAAEGKAVGTGPGSRVSRAARENTP